MTPALTAQAVPSPGPGPVTVVQLLASPFLGGVERQLLGLAVNLPAPYRTAFLTFAERGLAMPFVEEARRQGFETVVLRSNAPRFFRCISEIAGELRRLRADVLCCSGYKSDLLGWRAARRVGVPVVGIAHGWTGATWKVRLNEWIDKLVLRQLDAVVSVSAAQAAKVRAAGVAPACMATIPNAVGPDAFAPPQPEYAGRLRALLPAPVRHVVGCAARLSPEKGVGRLVAAAAGTPAEVGFVVFGDGPLRGEIEKQIAALGLGQRFVLAGFRDDVRRYLPYLDLLAIPSFTEGLPVVLLEAFAAGVPVVASAVGGIPEVLEDGRSGFLVPPADAAALATAIGRALSDEEARREMGRRGRDRVREDYSFARQSAAYQELFGRLLRSRP
jgi:glycosyltransferase involved in cell wall biosynthesis